MSVATFRFSSKWLPTNSREATGIFVMKALAYDRDSLRGRHTL